MSRNIEYIKKSEARIMVLLELCDNPLKCGKKISEKLEIDYIYTMKLLGIMYDKGWLRAHQYNFTTYFELSDKAPINQAKSIISDPQSKIQIQDDNRKIQESNLAAPGNEPQQPVQQ